MAIITTSNNYQYDEELSQVWIMKLSVEEGVIQTPVVFETMDWDEREVTEPEIVHEANRLLDSYHLDENQYGATFTFLHMRQLNKDTDIVLVKTLPAGREIENRDELDRRDLQTPAQFLAANGGTDAEVAELQHEEQKVNEDTTETIEEAPK